MEGLHSQQTDLTEAKDQNMKLASDLRETDARLKVATEELGSSLGLTQKQMDDRAQEIHPPRAGPGVASQRLETAQKQTAQQVSASPAKSRM